MAYLLGFAQFPQTFPPRYVNTKTLQKEWKLSMQRWPSGGVVLGGYFASSRHGGEGRISSKNTTLWVVFLERATRLELASRHPTNGCRHSQEPCLTSDQTCFAQVEAASSPVLRHIPKRIPHPVGWGILFGAGDEARTRFPASHEWLSPFAGALPHLRSNVLRTGRGSDFQPARCLIPKEKIPS